MNWTSIEAVLFRARHWSWTAGALVAIVAVGVVDYATGREITFSLFYLVPVATAAWLSGTAVAVAASVFAAIVWLCAEFASRRLDANLFVYVWNLFARLLFLLLVALLLARLRLMLSREQNLSRTDPLTGLLNPRAFREIAESEITRAQRYGHPLSLAFVDVDDFKLVNDNRGHRAGDQLLKRIAGIIRNNLRGSDSVARYGGDEFVLLLPVADQDDARAVVDKLRASVGKATLVEKRPVTLSIGVVTCAPGGRGITVDAMLEIADRLMYEVKSGGRSGARFASCDG